MLIYWPFSHGPRKIPLFRKAHCVGRSSDEWVRNYAWQIMSAPPHVIFTALSLLVE